MGTKALIISATILGAVLLSNLAGGRAGAPPTDLRDAVAGDSALEQLVDGDGTVDFSAPRASYLPAVSSTPEEIPVADGVMSLLASTAEGRDLLGHFKRGVAELPKLVRSGELSGADAETARDASIIHEENRVALFIKNENFGNGRSHIIFYETGWPLPAMTCVAAHELQHAVDQGAPWYRRINGMLEKAGEKLEAASASGVWRLEDLALEETVYGLGYVKTFFSEYLAYSRSSAVFRELAARNPAIRDQFSNFRKIGVNGKSIIEQDPLHDPGDRRDFMERYFWPGNRSRFKAGVAALQGNEQLLSELQTAGLGPAVAELSAFYRSPDPVYTPVHSLR